MLAELNVQPPRHWQLWLGVAVGVLAHVGLAAYAGKQKPKERVVALDRVVELFDVPPPPPPPPPAVVEDKPAAPTAAQELRAERAEPPPPAQAGKVIAAEAPADPAEPVDFTMAQGEAAHYAGGVTAGNGTNTVATAVGPTRVGAAPGARSGGATIVDQSAPVKLDADRWECPWPSQAEAEAIDRERVTIRVVVGKDGEVESAQIVDDPGRGFGAAALACARRGRGFVAARDRNGERIRAESPPIRVTFTR